MLAWQARQYHCNGTGAYPKHAGAGRAARLQWVCRAALGGGMSCAPIAKSLIQYNRPLVSSLRTITGGTSAQGEANVTTELYLDDAYLRTSESMVTRVDERGIQLERTPCYALGGGQPGDRGTLVLPDGRRIEIATTIRDRDTGEILHVPVEGSAVELRPGDAVTASIDWDLRHAHMRCHTCLHLLCALIPFPVTGGSVRAGTGRLDFDIPQPILDKEELTAKLNELIARNAPVSFELISEEQLRAKPELVRTLQVGPPARDGKIRLVRIEGIDLQPCGGSHLRATGEIGRARIVKMEKKGRQNRRVEIAIEDA